MILADEKRKLWFGLCWWALTLTQRTEVKAAVTSDDGGQGNFSKVIRTRQCRLYWSISSFFPWKVHLAGWGLFFWKFSKKKEKSPVCWRTDGKNGGTNPSSCWRHTAADPCVFLNGQWPDRLLDWTGRRIMGRADLLPAAVRQRKFAIYLHFHSSQIVLFFLKWVSLGVKRRLDQLIMNNFINLILILI